MARDYLRGSSFVCRCIANSRLIAFRIIENVLTDTNVQNKITFARSKLFSVFRKRFPLFPEPHETRVSIDWFINLDHTGIPHVFEWIRRFEIDFGLFTLTHGTLTCLHRSIGIVLTNCSAFRSSIEYIEIFSCAFGRCDCVAERIPRNQITEARR